MAAGTVLQATPKKSGGGKILFFAFLALVGALVFQLVGIIVLTLMAIPTSGLVSMMLAELIGAGGLAIGMILLGGRSWLAPSRTDVRNMLKTAWPILVADAVMCVVGCVAFAMEGTSVSANWLPDLAVCAVLCLGIGLAEELQFRGLVLNGLLAPLGKTHRGTMIAIGITSLLFGFVHVDVTTDFASPLLATQAVLKIVQTGLFSIILCNIVLRTHKLGGAIVLHALSDFLLMVPSVVLAGEGLNVSYTSNGEDGITTIVFYLVVIAFYLPFAIKAVRAMRRGRLAYRGAFVSEDATTTDLVLEA